MYKDWSVRVRNHRDCAKRLGLLTARLYQTRAMAAATATVSSCDVVDTALSEEPAAAPSLMLLRSAPASSRAALIVGFLATVATKAQTDASIVGVISATMPATQLSHPHVMNEANFGPAFASSALKSASVGNMLSSSSSVCAFISAMH